MKVNSSYLVAVVILSLLFIMCRENDKRVRRDGFGYQISNYNDKTYTTYDLRTAKVPDKLRGTQVRYINASDSVDKNADTVGFCMMQNEDLVLLAYNEYATRIGRDFQMSKFLPQSDVAIFKKHLRQLDSGDYIQEMARNRILGDTGSLCDLSYFLELFHFDSINSELGNKLTWCFCTDSTASDTIEISRLCFADSGLNNALRLEKKLLNNAWVIDTTGMTGDSVDYENDSLQGFNEYRPNFNIPEFYSLREQYMRNDSFINKYYQTFSTMLQTRDTLAQYFETSVTK